MKLERQIEEKALALGFDAVGITDAAPIDPIQAKRFRDWLDAGFAGTMGYMARNVSKRLAPNELLAAAQSVVVVALNYKQTEPAGKPEGLYGRVAQYACYEDYHDFMKPLLHELAAFIRESTKETTRSKVCVDSVPLAERALAMRAALGFPGRNHMLIHPTLGPQIFLGEIVTTAKFDATNSAERHASAEQTCSCCNHCVAACPTGALRADGRFDATRCISYLTIEYKGDVDPNLAARIGDHLFGCDECVMACPYRQAAPLCANRRLQFHPDRQYLNLTDILEMTSVQFETRFAGSPIHRLGLEVFKRNSRIAIDNSQQT